MLISMFFWIHKYGYCGTVENQRLCETRFRLGVHRNENRDTYK